MMAHSVRPHEIVLIVEEEALQWHWSTSTARLAAGGVWSGGLLAVWIAHVLADLTIIGLIVWS